MLDLISQYNSIKQDIDKAITDVLNSGAYIMGYQVLVSSKNTWKNFLA